MQSWFHETPLYTIGAVNGIFYDIYGYANVEKGLVYYSFAFLGVQEGIAANSEVPTYRKGGGRACIASLKV